MEEVFEELNGRIGANTGYHVETLLEDLRFVKSELR